MLSSLFADGGAGNRRHEPSVGADRRLRRDVVGYLMQDRGLPIAVALPATVALGGLLAV